MCERGMGSSVGQEPKLITEITRWAKEFAKTPVLVKLTPNTGDIVEAGVAARAGSADGLSLINTIKSIVNVDLDRLVPNPRVADGSTNGGYCGPAVKPIALHMVAALAREHEVGIKVLKEQSATQKSSGEKWELPPQGEEVQDVRSATQKASGEKWENRAWLIAAAVITSLFGAFLSLLGGSIALAIAVLKK